LFLAAVCLASCVTKRVAAPEYHYKDSVRTRYVRDSVWLHDSVYVNRYTQGDTVYLTKSVTRYAYKDRVRMDTVCVVRTDSVPYPVEKRVTEYKCRQRWYEAVACKIGYAILIFALSAAVVWLIKRKG